jgi:hypothetical protein
MWFFGIGTCLLLILLQACGVGIEPYPLAKGESFTLEFNGPVQYSYTLNDGTPVTGTIEKEEVFEVVNTYYDPDPLKNSDEYTLLYARLPAGAVEFHFGYDPEVERPGDPKKVFDDTLVNGFKANARMVLRDKGVEFNKEQPITFTGNFTGVTSTRFEIICLTPEGRSGGAMETCSLPNISVAGGKLVEKHYTQDEIMGFLADNHNSQIISSPPESGSRAILNFKVKNTAQAAQEKKPEDETGSGLHAEFDTEAPTGGSCSLIPGNLPPPALGNGALFLMAILGGTLRLLSRKTD